MGDFLWRNQKSQMARALTIGNRLRSGHRNGRKLRRYPERAGHRNGPSFDGAGGHERICRSVNEMELLRRRRRCDSLKDRLRSSLFLSPDPLLNQDRRYNSDDRRRLNSVKDEGEALRDIAKTLGNEYLFPEVEEVCSSSSEEEEDQVSSCMDLKGNQTTVVICNCSYANSTLCHVTSLYHFFISHSIYNLVTKSVMLVRGLHRCVKRQSLPGQLPPQLVRLPYLQQIDLTSNLLNGTIPKEWGRMMNLTFIVVEFNQMSGNLPPELGNLSQLQRLQISSNNFTGELPSTLAKLTSLQIVVIQGSGFSGPIPSGISALENLIDLRISDLNGAENSPFPQIKNMSMKILILRSCNINGTLPTYLGSMTSLKTL
ncbi:hypothetical protein PIB30_052707 [Stylosanthes scabra]|uniref:LRR receptor-like serine/threonine-protein kinase n=1 Tax=Stylosanthes scabra TaxID=79078 RepID=A0ABU6YGV3_9FABA|nr:hypothetical protein [Stylosanthes scabra]